MKTTLLRTLLAVGLSLGVLSARAAITAGEATVLRITGNATASSGPGQAAVPLRVGDKLQQGATITTGAGAEVHIQPFNGAVSTIKANSTVSLDKLSLDMNGTTVRKQTALLNLKSGNLVSTIDPSKKDINDYGVSTPKGVAAARGTQVTTQVNGQDVTVAATADTVTFTLGDGSSYTISQGQVVVTPPGGTPLPPQPLATLASSNAPGAAEARAAVQAGVAAMATVLQNNLGGLSTTDSADLASKVVSVAAKADPAQAAAVTAQVVNAVASSNKTGADVSDTVATIVAAAASSAPDQKTAIGTATVGALASNTAAATTNTKNAATATLQALASTLTTVEAKRDLGAATAQAAPSLTGEINLGIGSTVTSQASKDIIAGGVATGSGKTVETIKTETTTTTTTVTPPKLDAIDQGITTGGGGTVATPAFPAQPNNNTENTTITQ